jgi:hypothetical protein
MGRVSAITALLLFAIGASAGAIELGAVKALRPGRAFCDNSLCVRLPPGWTVRTDYGGTAIRIIAAPFGLPNWVGCNHEGVIDIPHGRFVLMVVHSDRGYVDGFRRVRMLSVSQEHIMLEPSWNQGSRSFVTRNVTFLDRSVSIAVYFADARPTSDQVDLANEVLATAELAPPPPVTQ